MAFARAPADERRGDAIRQKMLRLFLDRREIQRSRGIEWRMNCSDETVKFD